MSETRKRRPDPNVVEWLQAVDQAELHISVLTIGELTRGVAQHRRRDPQAAASLEHWLRGIEDMFSDRVVPIDTAVATAWGHLGAIRPLPVIDSLIAATALAHGHRVVTRNVEDFAPTGVVVVNPWDAT